MSKSDVFDPNDEQLKLEMRAMAELLLDIYEYRRQNPPSTQSQDLGFLDAADHDRTMKERSSPG